MNRFTVIYLLLSLSCAPLQAAGSSGKSYRATLGELKKVSCELENAPLGSMDANLVHKKSELLSKLNEQTASLSQEEQAHFKLELLEATTCDDAEGNQNKALWDLLSG